jgi:hypothetical protein
MNIGERRCNPSAATKRDQRVAPACRAQEKGIASRVADGSRARSNENRRPVASMRNQDGGSVARVTRANRKCWRFIPGS